MALVIYFFSISFKNKKCLTKCVHIFSLPLLIFLSILFDKTRYFIRSGKSDQLKNKSNKLCWDATFILLNY